MIFFFAKIYEKVEHADAFIRGSLFANRLSYFKRIENLDGRGDKYEGAIMPRLDGLSITLTCTDIENGEVSEITIPVEDFAAPPIIQPTWLDHFNVFCMYAGYSGAFKEIPTDNLQCFQKQPEIPEDCTKLGQICRSNQGSYRSLSDASELPLNGRTTKSGGDCCGIMILKSARRA